MLLADVMFFLIWFCEKRWTSGQNFKCKDKSICASSSVTSMFDSTISKVEGCLLCLGFESSSVTIQYSNKLACNTASICTLTLQC